MESARDGDETLQRSWPIPWPAAAEGAGRGERTAVLTRGERRASSQRLRITFVVDRYWPSAGGVQQYVHHVARALAVHNDVTVLAHRIDDGPPARLEESLRHPEPFAGFDDAGARVVPVRLSSLRRAALLPMGIQVAPGLARYSYGRQRLALFALYGRVLAPVYRPHTRDADLVHSWTVGFPGAAASRAAQEARAPLVVTPFIHPGQWGEDVASRRLLASADRVHGLLDVERDTFHRMGVDPSRTATCGVCAPRVVPRPSGRSLRGQQGIDGPLVLFMGVRRPYKGHALLLHASHVVAQAIPSVTFAFVGPGPPLELQGVHARVIDVGARSDDERAAWLDAADVLCLPSSHEIFPVSILEAWSTGTAVLTSDLPPLVELMGKSGGGRTIERNKDAVARALIEMLRRPHDLRRMAAAGHEFWAANHTPRAVGDRLIDIYRGAIDGGS